MVTSALLPLSNSTSGYQHTSLSEDVQLCLKDDVDMYALQSITSTPMTTRDGSNMRVMATLMVLLPANYAATQQHGKSFFWRRSDSRQLVVPF
jgi:hypothetical protein